MNSKDIGATTRKRLHIFLLICFSVTWIYDFTVIRSISQIKNELINTVLSTLGMFFPLIAHLCTRVITKEGFDVSGEGSMMLKLDRKKLWWLIPAILLPFVYCEAGNGLLIWIYPKLLLSPGMRRLFGITAATVAEGIIRKSISALMFTLVAIGEESGFRGYMMPKLMELISPSKAVLIGGTIWGLWHLPLICMGLNFGTDYPGFPFVGILLMTADCICAGCILTLLTVKTKSIWPAAVMHAYNNSKPGILAFLMNTHELAKVDVIALSAISLIPIFIIGTICLCVMIKDKKRV